MEAYWRRCGVLLEEIWRLIGGDVEANWKRWGGLLDDIGWLIGGDEGLLEEMWMIFE